MLKILFIHMKLINSPINWEDQIKKKKMSLSFINKQVDIYFQQASVGLSNTIQMRKKKIMNQSHVETFPVNTKSQYKLHRIFRFVQFDSQTITP